MVLLNIFCCLKRLFEDFDQILDFTFNSNMKLKSCRNLLSSEIRHKLEETIKHY